MRILCTGISHKTAIVSLRERLSFRPAQLPYALADLRKRWPDGQFIILSTCNRTEIYCTRPLHGHPRDHELHTWLGEFHGLAAEQYTAALYTLVDAKAVYHLYEVACGLDSLVPGEVQIVSQLKEAGAASAHAGADGRLLSELVQSALHVAKHVHSETDIGAGKVSVASVAVDCLAQALDRLDGKRVLSVGAGKMSELMLRHLRGRGVRDIVVANRSPQRAQSLAAACGGTAVALEDIHRVIAECDVLLTSIAAGTPLITRRMLEATLAARNDQPLVIIDIAVPRDVEESVRDMSQVRLYNIDDLEAVVQRTLASRNGQRDPARLIVDKHVQQFMNKLRIREVAPLIDSLYRQMRQVADEELTSARNKLAGHEDIQADMAVLQRALHRTIRRILHPAVMNLRRLAPLTSTESYLAALRQLLSLVQGQDDTS